jgi:hypothetical protein
MFRAFDFLTILVNAVDLLPLFLRRLSNSDDDSGSVAGFVNNTRGLRALRALRLVRLATKLKAIRVALVLLVQVMYSCAAIAHR